MTNKKDNTTTILQLNRTIGHLSDDVWFGQADKNGNLTDGDTQRRFIYRAKNDGRWFYDWDENKTMALEITCEDNS